MHFPMASKFLLLLAASALAVLTKRDDPYSYSCLEARLDDNGVQQDFTGDCDSEPYGQYTRKTRLDLNLCYSVNEDGIIVAENRGIGLNTSQTTIQCENCVLTDGFGFQEERSIPRAPPTIFIHHEIYGCEGFVRSTVNLTDLLRNDDGYLKCFDNTAVFLSEFPNVS
ncbi:hypothetical protein M426DRAFT_268225 [Hypoxylon sp. CI-4A]|nr:hypothetical protein M426DRAFT_268225 [Hypoxylon sp. CI-4A]